MSVARSDEDPLAVEAGVWVIVLGEFTVFTVFFATFLYYRALSPEIFEASRISLRQDIGALNTLLLLASSWFVASAVRALRMVEQRNQAVPFLAGALACGAAFVVVKVFEYGDKVREGVNVLTNDFFMFYFMLTGIHLLHLLLGMALLGATVLHLKSRFAVPGAINYALIGFGSCFWHMVDILWIVLFPLLYLLQ